MYNLYELCDLFQDRSCFEHFNLNFYSNMIIDQLSMVEKCCQMTNYVNGGESV